MGCDTQAPPIPPLQDKYGISGVRKGESKFIVPNGTGLASLKRAVHQHAKRKGKRFTCRVVTEEGKEGVRIWRLS